MATASGDVTYFYSTITFGHFTILLAFFFVASTLIWGTADPRPHPFTVAARWMWRRGVKPAYWWLRYRYALAVWRYKARRAERRYPLPAPRVQGASWPVGGAS